MDTYPKSISKKYQAPLVYSEAGGSCVLCSSQNNMVIHHLDGDRSNNQNSNLTVLCRKCHSRYHMGSMMDWFPDFAKKFHSHSVISRLEEDKFHGSLTINFCDGVPNTAHINMCVKAYTSHYTDGHMYMSSGEPTITDGGG